MDICCCQCLGHIRLKVLASIVMVVLLCSPSAGQMVSIITTGDGDLQYLNDFGFDVRSKRSLVFDMMVCSDAIIVLHETHAYHHNAIEIVIGGGGNQWSAIRAKCRDCPEEEVRNGAHLNCSDFNTFWLTWTNPLTVRVGTGRVAGRNTFIAYQAEVSLPINYLYLTSGNSNKCHWKIEIEKTPWFLSPPHHEWTVITVEEDVVVGSTVYNVSTEDSGDLLDVLRDPGRQYFTISNHQMKLIKQLNFGAMKFIEVVLRASNKWGSVNQSMLINIQDVPQAPLVTLSGDLRVVEELPHGTPVYGLFTVTDGDADEHLTYSLHGEDSVYFTINPKTGELRTNHRLDREYPGNDVLDNLNLLVQDSTGRESLKVLAITVMDVDEFPTVCEQQLYYVSDQEVRVIEISNPFLEFTCSDRDWGSDRTFSLLGNGSGKVFWLHRTGDVFQVSLATKEFSFEEFEGSDDTVTLTVVDDNVHEINTSYTTLVVIKIVKNRNFPEWEWPAANQNGSIPELEVTENIPALSIITTLNATGAVVYVIQSVTTASGEEAPSSLFNLHPNTGILTVTTTLDGDSDTGGSEYYDFRVVAEGARPVRKRVNTTFRLVVRDVNDNAPHFTQPLFFVDANCPTNEMTVITRVTARDADSTSSMKFAMSPSRLLQIEANTGNLLWRDDPKKSSSAIEGNGSSDVNNLMDYNGEPIKVTRSPRLERQVMGWINETTRSRLLMDIKVKQRLKPPYDLLKVVVFDSETPEKNDFAYVLVNVVCDTYLSPVALVSNSVEQWVFKAISGILAIILLCIGAVYILKRTLFGTTTEVTPQNTTNPDGDDDNRITLVQPFRETSLPELGSFNRRQSAVQEEVSIIDLTGPLVPEKNFLESTAKT